MKTIDNIPTSKIQRATKIARDMVVKYGMSDVLGPIQYVQAFTSNKTRKFKVSRYLHELRRAG